MRLNLEQSAGINIIHAVAADEIRVGERVLRKSVIIGTRDIIADWPVTSTHQLDEKSLESVLALEPDVVLLGTGRRLAFPSRQVYGAVLARNIGLEVMDTAAACRTFNILAGEGRRVAAALILD